MTDGNDYIDGPTDGERLTKREYFAGLAMQGLLAAGEMREMEINEIAADAAQQADALLEALNK